jgi:uncharacterized repeat protein (TIGR01451 family)
MNMDHRLRILKSALIFLFLVGALFAALALLPVMAQTPGAPPAAPPAPELGEISAQLVASSTTGYVIDDGDNGFSTSATGWTPWAGGGYKADLLYAAPGSGSVWAQWKPDLYAGQYEVLVHYYAAAAHYSKAQYTVYYYGGSWTKPGGVNQQVKADGSPGPGDSGWYSLGEFRFQQGTSGYVRLTNATATGGTGTQVIADAVKFAPFEVWVNDDYTQSSHEGKTWGVNAFNNLQEGLLAVANRGTVYVKPGTYVGPITITKGITLTSTDGAASTVITAPTGTAVQILANGVTVQGFAVQSGGASWGIANYDDGLADWARGVHSYRILNNVVRGFQQGMYFFQAKGEIRSNTVYSNTERGLYIQEAPTDNPGGTSIVSNVLYGNGTDGGDDFDIELRDSYTGTVVMSNTITGGGGATEACIFVENNAGSAELTANTLSACTDGVFIRQNVNTNVIKVNLYRNVISGGTRGVHVRFAGGTPNIRQILIGGSLANSNRIFGNSDLELWLDNWTSDVTATYNYWGVCTWRAIEDEIYHNYDWGVLGRVTYEPALCVPTSIHVEARPTTIPGDGISTATITATVTDVKGDYAPAGTMIGVTTTLGSVPYGYVEENDPAVVWTGPAWGLLLNAHASHGQYAWAGANQCISWTFTGTAVSVVHLKQSGAGKANVYIDDLATIVKTIDMNSALPGPTVEWLVEDIITTALTASGQHTIMVCRDTGTPGNIFMDAFRSGGTVVSNGRIVTNLTSISEFPFPTDALTATVWASVYTGRIITDATASTVYPVLADTVDVVFQGTDVYVTKAASQSQVSPGRNITFTITYGNHGPALAKGVVVTDTLPSDFLYQTYSAKPTLPPPTVTINNEFIWSVGDLPVGATRFITVVARPDPSLSWPSTQQLRTNWAEISSKISDGTASNDSKDADVYVVPGPVASIAVTAVPPAIPADGVATSLITADARDGYDNPVLNGTVITFTTSLAGTIFQTTGTQTHVGTTTGGIATVNLRAGTVAGNSTITAKVGAKQGTTQVQLLALEPYTVTMSADPWRIPASNGTEFSTLSITVTDQYRNMVHGALVTVTTDVGELSLPGVVTGTEIVVTTTNGLASTRLASTESSMTATVTAAITTTGRPTATVQVYFMAALPYTITLSVYPDALTVCGAEATVTATIQDEFGNLVENGTAVYFDVIPGAAGEMVYRSMLTQNGVVTSTVRTKAYNLAPSNLMTVTVSAGRKSKSVLISLAAGPPGGVSFRMNPSAVPACGGIAEVEALVTDCAGNRVANGTPITFSVGSLATLVPETTSTSNGLAYTIVRSVNAAGSTVLTATVGSIVRTFVVVIDPGPADVIYMDISPDTILNCGGRSVITATLRDACGNLVKDGTMVTFGPTYGYVGLSRGYGPTAHGVVTTTATANQRKPIGSADWPLALEQVYAYSGAALQAFRNLWIRPGVPSQIAVSVDPEEIHILGDVNGYDIMVVADAMDCSGTAVEDGTLVTLRTNKGFFRESGQFWMEQTTLGGLVTGTLTSREIAGNVFITATAGSAVGTEQAYFIPDPPDYVVVWAVPAAIPADGRSRTTVWVEIEDYFGNLVGPGITVTFTAARGQFVGGGNSCTTNTTLDGLASCELIADTTPGTVIVIAETYNGVSGWFDLTFVEPHLIYVPMVRKSWLP